MKKILIISHAYCASENRRKIELLAEKGDLKTGVVFPNCWKTWHGETKAASPRDVSRQSSDNYESFPLPVYFGGDGGRYFYVPVNLLQVIRSFNPEIIHLEEEPWTPAALETVIINKLFFQKKLLIFSWENIDLPLGYWREWIERLTFNNADSAMAGNTEALKRLKKHGFNKRIEILPQFGVDTRHFKPLTEFDHDEKQPLTVGYVGRFVPEKGIDRLFEAVSKIAIPVRLLLVSTTANLPAELTEKAKSLGLWPKIEIVGGVPHHDLPKYIQRMQIFILPSQTTPTWKEQFGRLLIEAMACGVPVIGSSSGAIPEVIGPAGLIFDENSVEDLKNKIEKLLIDQPFRDQLAEAGLARVGAEFTFEKIADKTAEIYRSL